VFSLALDLTAGDGRLARNTATGMPLPRIVRSGQIYLGHDDVAQLAYAAVRYRLAVLFVAYTAGSGRWPLSASAGSI
jgi:hypothetical protein